MHRAVKKAARYVEAGIKTSKDLGKGSGPINHFHSSYNLPFAQYVLSDQLVLQSRKLMYFSGRFVEYLLDRPDVKDIWRQYTEHDFVNKMADGTLPIEQFKYYLIQDYLYLVCNSKTRGS